MKLAAFILMTYFATTFLLHTAENSKKTLPKKIDSEEEFSFARDMGRAMIEQQKENAEYFAKKITPTINPNRTPETKFYTPNGSPKPEHNQNNSTPDRVPRNQSSEWQDLETDIIRVTHFHDSSKKRLFAGIK